MPWKPLGDEPFPSLGPLVSAWITENLVVPDGTFAGQPLVLSDDQYKFLYNLLRLNPEAEYSPDLDSRLISGKAFAYSQGVYSRPKGAGKSPILAALCWAFALGPVLFGGWDEDGQPRGLPHPSPVISVLGSSQNNTKSIWDAILSCSDPENGSPLTDNYPGTLIGQTFVRFPNRTAQMSFVTTSSNTLQGLKSTFGVIEESALLVEANRGADAANTLIKNAIKVSGTVVQISNAYVKGENSAFESAHRAVQDYRDGLLMDDSAASRIYFDHREVPADTDIRDRDALKAGLEFAYQGSPWVDLDNIISQIYNPQLTEDEVRRFFLNQISGSSGAWIRPDEWEATKDTTKIVQFSDEITLGFDGSVREDSTALVGCRVSDGHLFLLGCWEKPRGVEGVNWEVNREAVDAAVQHAFESYRVVGMFADPAYWSDYIDKWSRMYSRHVRVKGPSVVNKFYWQMNRSTSVVAALDRMRQAVLAQTLTHDGSSILTRHVLQAVIRHSRVGDQVAKEHPKSDKKIDAAMAAMLAYECAAMARGSQNKIQDRIQRIR